MSFDNWSKLVGPDIIIFLFIISPLSQDNIMKYVKVYSVVSHKMLHLRILEVFQTFNLTVIDLFVIFLSTLNVIIRKPHPQIIPADNRKIAFVRFFPFQRDGKKHF